MIILTYNDDKIILLHFYIHMSLCYSYLKNKSMYRTIPFIIKQQGAGTQTDQSDNIVCDMTDWSKIKIIDTLGSGHFGTTFKISIDGCDGEYAMKRQKITVEEYESSIEAPHPVNLEQLFYKWISLLPASDKIFFMEMYGSRRIECDFQSVKSSVNEDLKNSKFCQESILQLKGDVMVKIFDRLTKNQFLSIFCQMIYATSLMHSAKYHHRDAKTDNICIEPTSEEYIKIGDNSIKTYGVVASLIDYGSILHDDVYFPNVPKDFIDMQKIIDTDTWNLIDCILLNNTYIYKQIAPDRMGIMPNEVFDIIKAIYRVSPKIYDHISSMLKDVGHNFDSHPIASDVPFIEIKKNHMFRALMYEFIQLLQIYHPEEFRNSISSYFNKQIKLSHLIEYELIKLIVENKTNPKYVIDIVKNVL
jgi:serine/threonine protein kinase